jgi:hypothetical protein
MGREQNLLSTSEVSLSMIPNPCIEVQTSPLDRPAVPAWFARSRHDGPSLGNGGTA